MPRRFEHIIIFLVLPNIKLNLLILNLSIVTISYNQADFLRQTIESVLSQDYKSIEYIIIDGGSTDSSLEIIKEYSDSLAYYVSEPDDGPAAALNKGFNKATGDFIYYINSDDVLIQGAISKVVKFIERQPNYDIYYGHGYITNSKLDNIRPIYSDRWNTVLYKLGLCTIIQQSTFIRKSAFLNSGGFNNSNKSQWDGELIVDLALSGSKFKRHNFHTAYFRVHPASTSGGAGDHEAYLQTKIRLNKKIESNSKSTSIPIIFYKFWRVLRDPIIIFRRLYVGKIW